MKDVAKFSDKGKEKVTSILEEKNDVLREKIIFDPKRDIMKGGCQGCESISSLSDAAVTKSEKLADKASSSYNAGRARTLATDFTYLKNSAGADKSSEATSCSNYQDHSDRYQSLKRRYNNLKEAIKKEKEDAERYNAASQAD
jgi:hypothetical protein